MDNERYGGGFFQILKGVVIALCFSLITVSAFAAVLRFTGVGDKGIYPVNQVIKALAIVIGCLSGLRNEKGFLKGVAVGLLFTALSYLAFSALGGDFSLSWVIFIELLLAVAVGGMSGALAVNLRRN